MFDSFRQSLRDLMDRATPPEERRAGLARMKQTLVTARMGLDDLRGGVAVTRSGSRPSSRELETMRRRKGYAAGINDAETVALAEKYEAHHAERVEVLQRKLDAQEAELAIAERDVAEMTAELKQRDAGRARARRRVDRRGGGRGGRGAGRVVELARTIDALGRASAPSERDADAEQRLAELKRRMGK